MNAFARARGASLWSWAWLALGCSAASVGVRSSAPRFEVHGHRGARGLRPESTLAGFEHAIELGVDAIELDVHRSADDALILWHDSAITAERCRYGAPLAQSDVLFAGRPAVRALTRAQLGVFECDGMDPDAAVRVAIPARFTPRSFALVTLDELFAFVRGLTQDRRAPLALRARAARVRFDVELKRGWDGDRADGRFEASVLRSIATHGMGDRVLLQSFDDATLRALRALDPRAQTSLLSTEPAGAAIARARALGATHWSPRLDRVSADAVREAHRAGLRVLVWTVNSEDGLRAMRAMGVDGVITDRPDRALREVGR